MKARNDIGTRAASAWYRQPVLWLGAFVFVISLAGCVWLIVVSVRCYGWGGPWADRGGFDMLGTAASGLAMLEGVNGVPSVPPTALINDYVTGYMGAAGATAALIRRANPAGRLSRPSGSTTTSAACQLPLHSSAAAAPCNSGARAANIA